MRTPGSTVWWRREWLPVAGLAALGCLFLWELVSLSGVSVARDMQMFFIGQKHLLWAALHRGEIPLWSPYYGTGAPFLANFQSGVLYPPHWLFAVLPFFAAFNGLVVLHFVLGGVFTYLLARRIALDVVPSLVTAVVFLLGGYFCSLLNLVNALQAAAWAPLLAYALLRHAEFRTALSLALLVAVALVSLLAGEPQTFLMASLVAGTLLLVRWPDLPAEARRSLPLLSSLAVGGLVLVGLAMVQILPTLEMIGESSRGGGLAYEEASFYSLEPLRLVHLILPADYRDPVYRFGMRSVIGRSGPWLFSIYLGASWLFLCWFAARGRRRREVVLWAGFFGLGLLLALGDHTPVYPWLFEQLPGVSAFRFPEKYFFFSGFAAAMLAGYGVQALWERPERRRIDGAVALAWLAALTAGRLAWASGRQALERFAAASFPNPMMLEDFDYAYGVWTAHFDKLIVLTVLTGGLLWAFRRGTLDRRLFAGLLLAVVTFDLASAHRHMNAVVEPEFYTTRPLIHDYVPLEEVRSTYRYRASPFDENVGAVKVVMGVPVEAQKWMWQQTVQPNTGQPWRVLSHDNWDAFKLRRTADERAFFAILPDWERRWRLLRLNSVRYAFSVNSLDHERYAREIPMDSLPGHLYELHDPLPRVYVVPRGDFVEGEVDAINAVLDEGFDPTLRVTLMRIAAVEPAASRPELAESPEPAEGPGPAAGPGLAAEPGFPGGYARILEERGGTVRIAVQAPAPGYLVLTDSYYPGWSARVDGEEREIFLANYFFRAVRVRPGDEEVVFRYRSRPFERGARVSLVTLLIAILGLGVSAWRRRGRRRGRPSGAPPADEGLAPPA